LAAQGFAVLAAQGLAAFAAQGFVAAGVAFPAHGFAALAAQGLAACATAGVGAAAIMPLTASADPTVSRDFRNFAIFAVSFGCESLVRGDLQAPMVRRTNLLCAIGRIRRSPRCLIHEPSAAHLSLISLRRGKRLRAGVRR
jgi:hypothetical protein